MFNEICINEEMLPKYTYIYIYIYLNYPVSAQGQCVWIIVLHRIYEGNHINL